MNFRAYFSAFGVFAFVFGVCLHVPTELPGNLKLGEILTVGLVVPAYHWFSQIHSLEKKQTYKVVGWLIALFSWHFVADTVVGTAFSNLIDIAGTIAFCGLKLFVLSSIFVRHPRSVVLFLIGLAVGYLGFSEQLEYSRTIIENEYWDIRIAPWAAPLLFASLLLVGELSFALSAIGVFVYAAAAAYYGARSHGLIMLLSIVLPGIIVTARDARVIHGKRSIWKIAALCVVGSLLFTFIYVEASRAGLMTEKSREQLRAIKNPYNPIELIRSGRAGTIIGLQQAFDRPLFGYGSLQFQSKQKIKGHTGNDSDILHAIVIESMIYGGLLTVVIWFMIAREILAVYPPIPPRGVPITGYHILATIALMTIAWSFLFSPFVSVRLDLPLYFAILVHCNYMLRVSSQAKYAPRPIAQRHPYGAPRRI